MDSNMPKNIDPFLQSEGSLDKNVQGNLERESWKDMVQRFYEDVTHLFEKEGQLIRAEVNEKFGQVKSGSVSLIVGGAFLFVGVLCVAATAIIALDIVTELWLASTIVTLVLLVTGAIMLGAAKKKLEADRLKPNKSVQAFNEIRYSLKEKVNEITKH